MTVTPWSEEIIQKVIEAIKEDFEKQAGKEGGYFRRGTLIKNYVRVDSVIDLEKTARAINVALSPENTPESDASFVKYMTDR